MKINLVEFSGGLNHFFGSVEGKKCFHKLKSAIEQNPLSKVVEICLKDVLIADVTFLRESIVSLAKFYRGSKFIVVLASDERISSNWEGATNAISVNLQFVASGNIDYIGPRIGKVDRAILNTLNEQHSATSNDVSRKLLISVQNASSRLKHLFKMGLLMREEGTAGSGGKEFTYIAPYPKSAITAS